MTTIKTVPFAIVLLVPVLALAAGPSPSPAIVDPLAAPLDTFVKTLRKELGPAYRAYESAIQPAKNLPTLAPPEVSLERMLEVDALSALPESWVKTLNALGDRARSRGEAEAANPEIPAEYRPFEASYAAEEPAAAPLKRAEELATGLPSGAPADLKALVDGMRKLAPEIKNPKKLEEYGRLAKQVEQTLKHRCRAALVGALAPLKSSVQALAGPAQKVDPSSPWTSLGSQELDRRAVRWLAECYFKGRWKGAAGGPKSTGSGTSPAVVTGQGTGAGNATAPGGTGTGAGEGVNPPSSTGTGSGTASPDAAKGPPGSGTGDGSQQAPGSDR
ncbi:MAG: hypothetical protein HY815_07920 [Candidatus Riflebacteria bacterium]|nr:hypothetical protein [Candidatus Riflebacteria bacterium]